MKSLAIIVIVIALCAIFVHSYDSHTCGENEVFKFCTDACDQYCDGHDCGIRYFTCPNRCTCANGYIRNNDEQCISKDQCP
ncbi:hypothetical protein DMENIID0001_048460 [Sergentomyia squamirostris]